MPLTSAMKIVGYAAAPLATRKARHAKRLTHLQEHPQEQLPARHSTRFTKDPDEPHQQRDTEPSISATIPCCMGLGSRLPPKDRMFDVDRCAVDPVKVAARVSIEGVNIIGDAFALPMRFRFLLPHAPAVHRHCVVRGPRAFPKGG
jgi:hypothetical protein